MKFNKIIAAALIFAGVVACAPKGGEPVESAAGEEEIAKAADPASYVPTKAEIDSVSYLMGITFGNFVKGYNFADNTKGINFAQLKKGMEDLLTNPYEYRDSNYVKQFKISPELMNDVFGKYLEKRQNYTSALQSQEEEKFFAKVAKTAEKDGLQKTESGLYYKIEAEGSEDKVGPQDTVYVHYTGTLIDGKKFDGTEAEQPAVRMIMNRVIAGWTEGMQLVGKGGKIHLVIPSKLAYGERGSQAIKPNSPLIFDVQVDSVCHFVPKTEETK